MKINLHYFSRTLFLPIFFIFILPANSCSPNEPDEISLWGAISRIKKNNSGKIWVVLEMGSQVYSVLQGSP